MYARGVYRDKALKFIDAFLKVTLVSGLPWFLVRDPRVAPEDHADGPALPAAPDRPCAWRGAACGAHGQLGPTPTER